jgi:RNA polymerase-binding protein DksA
MAAVQADQVRRVRARLEERVAVLGREIASKSDPAAPTGEATGPVVDDLAARGEELTRQMVTDAERARDAAELRDIEAALTRLRQGSYGECVDCGVDIAPARLEAQPAAARCIECQSAYEGAQTNPPASAR